MSYPSIVLAICTYNNHEILARTLSCIAQQQVVPKIKWSVLVIDNHCTDHTSAIVQKHIASGDIPTLRLVQESQQGLSYARRRAVRESEADWIAFVDDDCFLPPDWVQQAVVFCAEHPKAGAIGGKVDLLWEVPPQEFLRGYEHDFAQQDYGDSPLCLSFTGLQCLNGAGLLLQRRLLLASGWLEEMILAGRNGKMLSSGSDTEIVLRLRNAGNELWYNPKMKLQHYIPKRRMSVDYLCRLHRGFGQSHPILLMLAERRSPTLLTKLYLCLRSLMFLARRSLKIANPLCWYRGISCRTSLQYVLGYMEGAFTFLFQKKPFNNAQPHLRSEGKISSPF